MTTYRIKTVPSAVGAYPSILPHTRAWVPVAGSQGGGGKFTIKGNVWTFPWQVKQDGKTIYFQVLNTFTTHSTIEYLQEFSEDNVHWTVTAKGIEHKVEGAR